MVEKRTKSREISTQIITITYKYNGDNIAEQVVSSDFEEDGMKGSYTVKTTFDKYDTKSYNPYYKSFEGGAITSSKNLPLETTSVSSMIIKDYPPFTFTVKCEYSYTLEKNYPTEIRTFILDDDGESEEYTTFIEYKK